MTCVMGRGFMVNDKGLEKCGKIKSSVKLSSFKSILFYCQVLMNIIKIPWQRSWMEELAFKLLLGPQVIAVSTLLLATVDRTRVKTGITPGKSVTKVFSEVANILLLSKFLPFM